MTLAQTLALIAATIPQAVLDLPTIETVVTFCTPWADALEAMPSDPRND